MLKRIYVDNYKCLTNFELKFNELSMLLGANGCGKSTVFEVIKNIRDFLSGDFRVDTAFPAKSLTRWDKRPKQTFELNIEGPSGIYDYALIIEHTPDRKKARVDQEILFLNDKPLFQFKQGEVQLYKDNHQLGPSFSFSWDQSGIGALVSERENQHLRWFRDQVSQFLVVSPKPDRMICDTSEEDELLSVSGHNYSSWYRYLSDEYQSQIFQLYPKLQKALPGFHSFKLEKAGADNKILKVGFLEEKNEKIIFFRFDELSDGERQIIVLYTLLLASSEAGYTLFIDEPDNYISLPELQPWLMELHDSCEGDLCQAVLISHHPELINYLGGESGLWLKREPNAPARVIEGPRDNESGLPLSEIVARGWSHE